MTRTFDFRHGHNGWGHALHSFTWREEPPRTRKRLLRKPEPVARRARVMVHVTPEPNEGDRVLFTGEQAEWDVAVVEVRPLYNPSDMFTLVLEFDKPPLSDAPELVEDGATPLQNPPSKASL